MIRRARVGDATALAELNARAWWAAYADYVDHELLRAAAPGLEGAWAARLAEPRGVEAWVLDRDGRLEGWVSVGDSRDRDAREGEGELWALYLAPERLGSGDGVALLRHGEERLEALGFAGATLWVFERNARARAFYEREGWRLDERAGVNPWDWGPCVRYRKAWGR